MSQQTESDDPLSKIHIKGKKQFAATRISQAQAAQSTPTDRQNQNAGSTRIPEASTTMIPSVPSIAGKKRKATEIDGAPDRRVALQAEPKQKQFSYLKKHTRRVPQDVVKKRWKALPAPAQRQVRELFSAAKRSVMHGAKDERRAREIETALGAVLRRLEKQLPRMPFPPKSREGDFSLDRIVDRMRKLEAELTPATHAVGLLESAIEEEEKLLERDREALEDLKRDVRYEESRREKQTRAIHPLLQCLEKSDSMTDDAESIGLAAKEQEEEEMIEDTDDPDLQPLLRQFKNHLTSIMANQVQVAGLRESISRAEVSLTGAL